MQARKNGGLFSKRGGGSGMISGPSGTLKARRDKAFRQGRAPAIANNALRFRSMHHHNAREERTMETRSG